MRLTGALLAMTLALGATLHAQAPEPKVADGGSMTFHLELRNGSGDDPMIVLWLEDADREFVQTLQRFSKAKKYYKDLTTWTLRSSGAKEDHKALDAVTSPTIKWNGTGDFSIPLRTDAYDLTKGGYRIRIESRRDKGGHYRTFQIPVEAGFTGGEFEDDGYVKKITIKVEGNQQ